MTGLSVGGHAFFLPLGTDEARNEEKARLEKELAYAQGFLASVLKKLSNERFVQKAPAAVLAVERKKQVDAEAKIRLLQEQLT